MYHGKGYTQADVNRMTFDELQRHVTRLQKQLAEEHKARVEQQRQIDAQAKRARSAGRTPRRR